MKKLLHFLLTFGLCYCGSVLFAQTITVTGSPSFTISSSDVLAGDNLDTMLETSNSITIDIAHNKANWYTQVNKSDISWDGTVKIWVKRTGSGTPGRPASSVSGGTTYQEVTNTATNFFSGKFSSTGISIQYKITGQNVSLNAVTNTTTIIHTLYDN